MRQPGESLLFVGVHLPYWLTHEGFTATVLTNSIGVFISSLVAGGLYQKTTPSVNAGASEQCCRRFVTMTMLR